MKLNVLFQEKQDFNVFFQEKQNFNVKFHALETFTDPTDYEPLINKPSINGVELIGDKTGEELGLGSGSAEFPEEGNIGDILMKTSMEKSGVAWMTPASHSEEDNTRPITAAAVYTEIGNINALLATI